MFRYTLEYPCSGRHLIDSGQDWIPSETTAMSAAHLREPSALHSAFYAPPLQIRRQNKAVPNRASRGHDEGKITVTRKPGVRLPSLPPQKQTVRNATKGMGDMRYLSDEYIPELEGENPGTDQLLLLEQELADRGMHVDGGVLREADIHVLVTARPVRKNMLPPFLKD